MNKYEQELHNIKQYLINEGIKVDKVTRWQGGFGHYGTSMGLNIIATVESGIKEEQYCVPAYLVKQGEEIKKYIKL
jgi:hypothetical protein